MLFFFFWLGCSEFEGKYALDDDGDGFSEFDGDCNDQDSRIHPEMEEICDGDDNNCNDEIDEGAVDGIMWYPDDDGDGFGRTDDGVNSCSPPTGFVSEKGDCNDDNGAINPSAQEICDDLNIDENCNNYINEADEQGIFTEGTSTFYADSDGDGFGDPSRSVQLCHLIDLYVENNSDCDDSNEEVNPEAEEICDEIDNNCVDGIDEDFAVGENIQFYYLDIDGDTYGNNLELSESELIAADQEEYKSEEGQYLFVISCKSEAPIGYANNSQDCDDTKIFINPEGTEYCNDIDEDCDGETNDDESENAPYYFLDEDGDGFGGSYQQTDGFPYVIRACSTPFNYSSSNLDCEDNNNLVFPTAPEICDGIDNNCDENIDDSSSVNKETWYRDNDGDGYGTTAETFDACSVPDGFVDNSEDCNDQDSTLNQDDNDGDGATSCGGDCDDQDSSSNVLDLDGDGFSTCDGDCNDGNAEIFPSADELCDGIDNNCDENIDDASSVNKETWYRDNDGDGYGTTAETFDACSVPDGFVDNSEDCNDQDMTLNQDDSDGDGATSCGGDCDDQDSSSNILDLDGDGFSTCDGDCNDGAILIHPDADEICDGVDNNCDDSIDGPDATDRTRWYEDQDLDGFGSEVAYVNACTAPIGYLEDNSDCNDDDPNQNPEVDELCSSPDDDDCDGLVDEDDAVDAITFYQDNDSDGYGVELYTKQACTLPAGYAEQQGDDWDCDDNDSLARPFLTEYCNDKDDDCDGLVDELLSEDPDSPAQDTILFYQDLDGDGFGSLGSEAESLACPDDITDENGSVADNNDDCDDDNAAINPDADELCDETVDMNCDGEMTLGAVDPKTWYVDSDKDDYGDVNVSFVACTAPLGFIEDNTDCNDLDPEAFPNAVEICDGKLTNCYSDKELVEDILTGKMLPYDEWDDDGDGFVECDLSLNLLYWGSSQVAVDISTNTVSGLVGGDDCDDSESRYYPGATPLEGASACVKDVDGDGFGEINVIAPFDVGTDCDDSESRYYPGATPLEGASACVKDVDGDGFGEIDVIAPFDVGTDCDDTRDFVYPSAPETCNGQYDGCNEPVFDEGADVDEVDYIPADEYDNDGDGFVECDREGDPLPLNEYGLPDWFGEFIDDDEDGVSDVLELVDGAYYVFGGDCRDNDEFTYPGAAYLTSETDCLRDAAGVGGVGDPDGYSDCVFTHCDYGVFLTADVGPDFVLIEGDDLIDPLGRYTIPQAFYIMTTEVTQAMYEEVTGNNPSSYSGANKPVETVSWYDSAAYANALSQDQGFEMCYTCDDTNNVQPCVESVEFTDYYECEGYTLPNEHEWELAARSGTTKDFWTGEGDDLGGNLGGNYSGSSCDAGVTIQDGVSNPLLGDYGWFCENNSPNGTKNVGLKLPNGFGLYDMHGNITEWNSDSWGCVYPNTNAYTCAHNSLSRVFRGGNFLGYPSNLRASIRGHISASGTYYFVGFRLRRRAP